MDGSLTVRALTPETRDAFAGLVEKHNGIVSGCWCIFFHPDQPLQMVRNGQGVGVAARRQVAERRLHESGARLDENCSA